MEKRLSLYPQGPQVLHWLAVVTVPPLRLLAWVQELPPLRMLSSVEGPVQELPPLRVFFFGGGATILAVDMSGTSRRSKGSMAHTRHLLLAYIREQCGCMIIFGITIFGIIIKEKQPLSSGYTACRGLLQLRRDLKF